VKDTSEREIRKEIFQDTMQRCETEPCLKEAIEASLENQFVVHNGRCQKTAMTHTGMIKRRIS
jgi:hypothetical protein